MLGLNLREWREQENMPHPSISVTDSKGNCDHLHNDTVGPSEDRRGAIDLAIIREDLSRPQMFLRWVDEKAQVADALTKLHVEGDFVASGVPSSIHGVGRGTSQTPRETRAGKGTESQVTVKVAGACGRNVDACDHNDNRDVTRNPVRTLLYFHVIQSSVQGQV